MRVSWKLIPLVTMMVPLNSCLSRKIPPITGMDELIIALYAKGLSNQEIVEMFKERYDADVSSSLISRVTDSVKERLLEWQNRAVDAVYPIVYFDCIVVKVRQDGRIINKSVFVALDVNLEGHKELLGL